MKLFQVTKRSDGQFCLAGIFTDPDAAETFIEARALIDDATYDTRVVESDEPCDGYEAEYAAYTDEQRLEISLYCLQNTLRDALMLLKLKLARRCTGCRTPGTRCPS